ncbi:helix-turn-helix domain-containing protein [Sphingomonas sp. UNC305MFCol5.2]|uniref:helix-turn-helix domain-containing protein n=1 Tax=Sphingomonas sp. UNC305MFCol5.2 TaxID=1449076 RepID=UPI0004A70D58|nr:helix-turn-helix domain-containing protein [Sphingomonas sp. UNC305MFCol5.2]
MDDANTRAAEARLGSPYLDTKQAAHHLGLSVRTLEFMRRKRKGPPFRRHGGRVRYHIDELDSWSRGAGRSRLHD